MFWFLKRKKRKRDEPERRESSSDARDLDVDFFSDGLASVSEIDMCGECAMSPNGKFLLVWQDADPTELGHERRGNQNGRYALMEGRVLRAKGELPRPENGAVADTGVFVLNDFTFVTSPATVFWAFDETGRALFSHRFGANSVSCAISPSGRHAIVQLANSDNEDCSRLACFDLSERQLIWKIYPPTGWARSYRFDEQAGIVELHYDKLGAFKYTLAGEFLDAERYQSARIKTGLPDDVLAVIEERIESAGENVDALREVIPLFDVSAQRDPYDDDNLKARICRRRGEVYEMLGELRLAVDEYERAISLFSRIGVKRRLTSLKKKLDA